MQISCPKCSKKFQVNDDLIPEKGRLLQCSNCNHKWFFTVPKKKKKKKKIKLKKKKNKKLSS